MEIDDVTLTKMLASFDEAMAEQIKHTDGPWVDVRRLGEVMGYTLCGAIAQSGIDHRDGNTMLQELALGLINGVFYAGDLQGVAWYATLTDSQANYLEEATGVQSYAVQ